jgi:hypothetical protein
MTIRETIVKRYFTAMSLLLIIGLSASARAAERTEGLNLELTPYFWAAGIDGKLAARGQRVNFNQSFSDLISDVDAGFMGLAIATYNRFVLYLDYDYISLSSDGRASGSLGFLPPRTRVTADTDLTVATVAGGYRFDTFGENTVDVLLGSRRLELDSTLKIPGPNLNRDDDITDTIVMVRPSFQFAEKWRFNPTLSYGISGDSDTTYELEPQLQYQVGDAVALRFGYKNLYYKQSSGRKSATPSTFREIDANLAGFFIGVGWTFPSR